MQRLWLAYVFSEARAQNAYDATSNHSLNEEQQKKWDKWMEGELKKPKDPNGRVPPWVKHLFAKNRVDMKKLYGKRKK